MEHEQGDTPQDWQARLAIHSSVSKDAAIAGFETAVARFIAASEKAKITEEQSADIAELNPMMDQLWTVAQVDPETVRSHACELGEVSRMREELAAELEAGASLPCAGFSSRTPSMSSKAFS